MRQRADGEQSAWERRNLMSTASILAVCVTLALTVVLPVGAMLLLGRRGGKWRCFFAGAAAFILFAMILEQLLHSAVLRSPAGAVLQGNIWLYGLYGGLAAGLFEETGRLAAFRLLLKKETRACDGRWPMAWVTGGSRQC